MKSDTFSDGEQSSVPIQTASRDTSSEDGAQSQQSDNSVSASVTANEEMVLDLFHAIRNLGHKKNRATKAVVMHNIKEYINAGVDVDAVRTLVGIDSYGSKHEFSPIRLAAYLGHDDVIQALIDGGAKVDNGRFVDQKTTIALAVEGKHVNTITTLYEGGGTVDPTADNPIGALEIAAYIGDIMATNILLAHDANIELLAPNGRTPLMTAAYEGRESVLAELASQYKKNHQLDINHRDNEGNTALMLGIISGNDQIVKSLLEAESNVLLENAAGDDALMLASYYGNEKIMQLLLNYGATTETRNEFGQTPLISAVSKGKSDAVSWLLSREEGVDINAVMNGGWTSIMIALQYGYLDIAHMLMDENNKHFLDLTKVNDDGNSVFDLAKYYAEQGYEGYDAIHDNLLALKSKYSEMKPLQHTDSFVVGLDGIEERSEEERSEEESDVSSLSSDQAVAPDKEQSDIVKTQESATDAYPRRDNLGVKLQPLLTDPPRLRSAPHVKGTILGPSVELVRGLTLPPKMTEVPRPSVASISARHGGVLEGTKETSGHSMT